MRQYKLNIIGGGNLGFAIASGLKKSGLYPGEKILITEIHPERQKFLKEQGFPVIAGAEDGVAHSEIILLTVKPYQLVSLLDKVGLLLEKGKNTLVSCIPGIPSSTVLKKVPKGLPFFRIMPNTAIAAGESASCISAFNSNDALNGQVEEIFRQVGKVYFIDESLMDAATVLGACGTAFVLRFIRALTEGAVEMGFPAKLATEIAGQTVKGAAELSLSSGNHPEEEIDKVTTPKGITIRGLNEMEHQGFSSSVIQGLMASFQKIIHSKT
jgi:pyrroline-5-carboxylate reductase